MNRTSVFGDEDLNCVLFGTIPKHEDLCCLKGTVSFIGNHATNISTKAYQCQIFKCRCLIFSVPDVIASPVLGAVENIYIIVNEGYYLSGKLKHHLKRIGIEATEPIKLTNAIYETCLRYTMLARLAPSWNQVEKYLVHGRDFLTSSAPLDAVKLDIVINETDMHVVLWPLRLRLPQVCAQDLHSSPPDSPFSLDVSSESPTVHVLPSLNKAQVLMVSGHIPQNSLFKSYKDLKRHWKNSYGYRLPESDDGIIYLTVNFGRWFSENLTYPIMCVRSRRPVFLRQHEPQNVLMKLLADLHVRIPQICGQPFAISSTVRYAVPKWNNVTEVTFPCNLSEEKPAVRSHLAIKGDDEELSLEIVSPAVSQYTQTQNDNRCDSAKGRSISPPPFLPRLSQCVPPTSNKPLYVPIFTAKPKFTGITKCSPGTTKCSPVQLPPRKPDRPLVFEEIQVKPVFGKPRVPQPYSTLPPTKLVPNVSGLKKIRPLPLFNPSPSRTPVKGENTPLELSETKSKKARNRPQVQQGVDVKALAMSKDGLVKVNTTTLIAYLRSEGVPCKVKDKKGELVAKVLAHLKLPPPTSVAAPSPQLGQFYNSQHCNYSQEFVME